MTKRKKRPKRISAEGGHWFRWVHDGMTGLTIGFVDGYRVQPPTEPFTYYLVIDG